MVEAVRSAPLAPAFLRLAGHPVRWRLLSALAHSDRRVGELTEIVGARQNLVSYHLRQLRSHGVVSARRSSADGRDTYYVLELGHCRDLLAKAAGALHPALARERGAADAASAAPLGSVLFLCTGNSGRSQMAEALCGLLSKGAVRASSAGSHPKPLHPDAILAMRERGVDISAWRSKHLSRFADQRLDYVVTLCDRVREVCPEFSGAAHAIHWSIPDPARADGPSFERVAGELEERLGFFIEAIKGAVDA